MLELIGRKRSQSRPAFLDFNNLGNVIARWLPFARRSSGVGAALQHLGTLPLTTQSSLTLVRVYNETLVLGITPHSVTLLTKAPDPDSYHVSTNQDSVASGKHHLSSSPI